MRKNLLVLFILLGLSLLFSLPVQAAAFSVNDAAPLIAAITIANSNGEDDVITLTADITLTTLNNTTDGDNGLPSILADSGNSLTIMGNGFTISRSGAIPFRILHVSAGANLSLSDVTIQSGTANDGGGIYNLGTLSLNNSTISGSLGLASGGGIYNSGTATVNNSTLSGNTATDEGGGIYNLGTATVSNSTLSGNTTLASGGGIYNSGTASLNVSNSTLSGNITLASGGGIYNLGTATVSNSTLSANSAIDVGGGIYNRGTATVSNSTLSANSALDSGGGIYNSGTASLNVSNSTLSGNTTLASGGGIYNSGTATMSNSTISANTILASGGGIYNSGTATVSNSIVAGNTSDECNLPSGTFNADANSIFGTNGSAGGCTGGTVLAGAIGTLLSLLADNGGPTETHALIAGSPAIDTSGAGATGSDQRGAAIFNSVRDVGAFEFSGIVPTVTVGIVSATTVAETGGVVTIPVTVANLAPGDSLTIIVNISGGTATETSDYTITASLTFNADGSQNFVITGLADALTEGDETLTVNFSLVGAADISGNGNQTVTIIERIVPGFTKAFTPSTIVLAGTSTLSFTIDNTASTFDATSLDFTDNLPAGMVVASPFNASTTCTGGTITALSGTGIISYTGGTVSALSSCTISVDVEGILVGTHSNLTGDLTSGLGNSGTAAADLIVNPSPASPAQNTLSGEPAIAVFDPAISKLGLLVPGQTGIIGEELEWIVTVSNVGTVAGTNVTITDTLIPALRIDSVDAPGGTVTISGQTVTVVYPTLAVGQTVQFSIFTTVLSGATIENTACVIASNQAVQECVTALPVSQLPSTGESPLWRYALLMAGIGMLLAAGLIITRRSKRANT